MSTNANFPGGDPFDPQGRLTPQWRAFFLALLSRTGGEGAPVDIKSLQTQLNAQTAEIGELFMHENSTVAGALLGTLLARVAVLEAALQSVVPVSPRAAAALPESVAVAARAAAQLPEPVPVAPRAPDDVRKLIEATA
ncbi:hypothetical protein [Burkholderia vietnamiensis]|uniref:hypothetical protein n=1 Tax=Burkholderia vietnamiensis TaxID=60552 RepID=UPI00075C25ED|nr:hypothetical protein [Burkholderia vietnamiensis]KVF35780.1 hypothetical protein WJ09_09810 [Burkholderia vietnamiensis]